MEKHTKSCAFVVSEVCVKLLFKKKKHMDTGMLGEYGVDWHSEGRLEQGRMPDGWRKSEMILVTKTTYRSVRTTE